MADIMEMNFEPEKLDYDTGLGDIELDFPAPDGEDELMLDEEQIVDQPMGDDFDASLDDEMADASNEITYSDSAEVDMQAPQQPFVQEQIDLNFAEVPQSVAGESITYAQSFADPREAANLDTLDPLEHIPVAEASAQLEQPAEANPLEVGLGQESSPKIELAILPEDGESQFVENVPHTIPQNEPIGTVSEDARSAIEQPSQVSDPENEQTKPSEQVEYHEEEHNHSGTVVIVEYEGTQLSLFSSTASQNIAGVPETYLLQDAKLGDSNISTLLTACREIFRESLLPFEELQIHLSQLDLSISETDAHTCGDGVTMNSLVELYCALHRNDGNSEFKPLHINLNRKHKALERLEYLHQALAEGKGFFDLDLDEIADENGDSTPHAEPAVTEPSASQQSGAELISHGHEDNAGQVESQPSQDEAQSAENWDSAATEGLTGSTSQDGKESKPQDVSATKVASEADQDKNDADAGSPENLDVGQISTKLQNTAPTESENAPAAQNEHTSLLEKETNKHAHPELPAALSAAHDLGAGKTSEQEVSEVIDFHEEQTHEENEDHITFEDPDAAAEFDVSDEENDGGLEPVEGDIEEYDEEEEEAPADQENGDELETVSNGTYEVPQYEEDPDNFGGLDDYDDDAAEEAHAHPIQALAEDIDDHNSSQETSTNKRARSLEYDDLESDPETKRSKP